MDEVFEEEGPDLTRDWDGSTTEAPPVTEWSNI
jgi:hypothetical protein